MHLGWSAPHAAGGVAASGEGSRGVLRAEGVLLEAHREWKELADSPATWCLHDQAQEGQQAEADSPRPQCDVGEQMACAAVRPKSTYQISGVQDGGSSAEAPVVAIPAVSQPEVEDLIVVDVIPGPHHAIAERSHSRLSSPQRSALSHQQEPGASSA